MVYEGGSQNNIQECWFKIIKLYSFILTTTLLYTSKPTKKEYLRNQLLWYTQTKLFVITSSTLVFFHFRTLPFQSHWDVHLVLFIKFRLFDCLLGMLLAFIPQKRLEWDTECTVTTSNETPTHLHPRQYYQRSLLASMESCDWEVVRVRPDKCRHNWINKFSYLTLKPLSCARLRS